MATSDPALGKKLAKFKKDMARQVEAKAKKVESL
jgi:phosphoribosylcarboxyaminoimidazole (NCAIR) mutase